MKSRPLPVPDGVLLVDKPGDWTSFDVVRKIKSLVKPTKVGHTGTLDPMATGLLPLVLGEATKLTRWLTSGPKRYQAQVQLGLSTDTLDATGQPLERAAVPDLSEDRVRAVLAQFQGTQLQIPPMVSALHHQGERLYALARRGIEVERKPRQVEIHSLELVGLWRDRLELDVRCSSGTYIRSLAADIGQRLGSLAHLSALRRTESGGFDLDRALDPRTIDPATLGGRILDLDQVLARYRRIDSSEEVVGRLAQGARLSRAQLEELGIACQAEEIAWFRPPEAVPIVLVRLTPASQGDGLEILRVLRSRPEKQKNH
jgi:tRNA pseudouridine55 synthase